MNNAVWTKALKSSADPQRARHHLELLAATSARPELERATAEQARILCALFSGSLSLSGWLIAHPELLPGLNVELLQHPRREQGLRREVDTWLVPLLKARDYAAAFSRLRQFKQREMLRIAARDLGRIGHVREIIRELSHVADVCLGAVMRLCWQQLQERLGEPRHQDADGRWQPTGFIILGLGKLGGQELNYGSDVDLIFVYAGEGRVFKVPPGGRKPVASSLTNHQFFERLGERIVAETGAMTEAGTLYRVDLRLRPEGDAGPVARSLDSCENYYAQWGQTWERLMLIKARGVAGDEVLAAEFLEMVQPFRHPRSLGERVLREVAAMKDRIEHEIVKSGELERNVKLGRGGIREIEFVAQTLQLIHGGRLPFLQGAQTLPALEKLVQYELLEAGAARRLTLAYEFFRNVEHRLQMEDDQQTHTIPLARPARERLAALMGFKSPEAFERARKQHADNVRAVYDKLLRADAPEPASELPREFAGSEARWREIFLQHAFKQPDQAVRLAGEFVNGPGYGHVSTRTVDLGLQLLGKFLVLCPSTAEPAGTFPAASPERRSVTGLSQSKAAKPVTDRRSTRSQVPSAAEPSGPGRTVVSESRVLSDPDRVLTRLDSFIAAYGARATLFETWTGNPQMFELLLLLFDRSEFLAETAIHVPDLVDSLVSSGRLRHHKSAAETLADLRHGSGDADQRLWLRRYHQAEQMRIGLRDILGLADAEQNLRELSALADACLQYALEMALRKCRIKGSPVVIIGLGKLGGEEINYGSDLDILFVTDAPEKELPKLQRLAVEVMESLSSRTELGQVFVTDARLRPDGEKGLLVNNLAAYEDYYRRRAQLWEIQTLTRTRPVAGNLELGRRFQDLAGVLTDFRAENVASGFRGRDVVADVAGKRNPARGIAATGGKTGLAAYSPDWREKIRQMRERIEKERTPAGKDDLAIKTGRGGLMDAEFIAQALCLAHGWQDANTLRALQRAREQRALPREDAQKLTDGFRELRRVEGILRRWSFEGETVLPDDPAPYYRVAVRCGFRNPEEFRAHLQQVRQNIRSAYSRLV